MHTATKQTIQINCTKKMVVRICDLLVHAWLGVVESLTGDVFMDTSIMDCCIRGIFSGERKVVPRNSHPVSVL